MLRVVFKGGKSFSLNKDLKVSSPSNYRLTSWQRRKARFGRERLVEEKFPRPREENCSFSPPRQKLVSRQNHYKVFNNSSRFKGRKINYSNRSLLCKRSGRCVISSQIRNLCHNLRDTRVRVRLSKREKFLACCRKEKSANKRGEKFREVEKLFN